MVRKYGSKKKFQATKWWWGTDEGRSVWEMEWVMDVELFLESEAWWGEDSPQCLAMMHEMFQHAAAKGWKEAEWILHWGCWQWLSQLNLAAGILAVQLVGPETSEKELQELYLEVYKLHRLPGSPPGEPALLEEVVSSLKDCQGWKEERTSAATARSWLADPQETEPPGRKKGTAQWGQGLRAGTTGDVAERNERGGTVRCSLKTILPPTAPLAWGQSPAKKQPPLKAQIWKSHQS